MLRRLSILGIKAIGLLFLTGGAMAQSWDYRFDGPESELMKLWPVPPVGFPNADFIQNRTIDTAIAEYRGSVGRIGIGGEQRAGMLYSYGSPRDNEIVVIHKAQFYLDASHRHYDTRVAWSPYKTERNVAAGSQSSDNFLAQVGLLNTYDFTNETDADVNVFVPPANVQDDLYYADRDLLRDLTPNPFQRMYFSNRDSFWLGFKEVSATAYVSGGGESEKGTTTVDVGLYNEDGLLVSLDTGIELEAFYNVYTGVGRIDTVYWYNVEFSIDFDPSDGSAAYVIAVDKYRVITEENGGATEEFIGQVGRYSGTTTPDLIATPQQILHPTLGYRIGDYAHISNEQGMFDFGSIAQTGGGSGGGGGGTGGGGGGGSGTGGTSGAVVAHYNFDGNYNDDSGNGYDLLSAGGVNLSNDSIGQPSGANARFNGAGDSLTVAMSDAAVLPSGGEALTLEAWIYPEIYVAYSVDNLPVLSLFQEWNSSLEVIDQKWGNSPRGPLVASATTDIVTAAQWTQAVSPNSWHKVQVTFDGGSAVSVTVDDIVIGAGSVSLDVDRGNDWVLTLGNFVGYLDEVTVFRGDGGSGGSGDEFSADTDTIALYHFNSDLSDASPNGHDLVSSGSVGFQSDDLSWMATSAGSAVRFGDLGDTLSVSIPDADVMPSGGQAITLDVRIYPRAYKGYANENVSIVSLSQEWDTAFELRDAKWGTNPTGPRVLTAGIPIATAADWAQAAPLNQWSRLQIRYNGDSTVATWVNGDLIGAVTLAPNLGRTNDWEIVLGNFDGDIDELLIQKGGTEAFANLTAQTAIVQLVTDAAQRSGVELDAQNLAGDPDGDGWSSASELALGSNPAGGEMPGFELVKDETGVTCVCFNVMHDGETTANGYRSAVFEYTVEGSTNAVDWAPLSVIEDAPRESEFSIAGQFERLTLRPQNIASDRQFLRLRISTTP
jgi:hypothetical protein